MRDDMQYINVEGSGGLVRDQETGAILNTNKSEIERARQRKILSKKLWYLCGTFNAPVRK